MNYETAAYNNLFHCLVIFSSLGNYFNAWGILTVSFDKSCAKKFDRL